MIAQRAKFMVAVAILVPALASIGGRKSTLDEQPEGRKSIVTSDTILSEMSQELLPSEYFEITAILPPGQCPGH